MKLFTDGSCIGSGVGAFSAFLFEGAEVKLVCAGKEDNTTNQVMELRGVEGALEFLESQKVEGGIVYTDSMYVVNGINSWYEGWEKNGFKTANKKPIKHLDLWRNLMGCYRRTKSSVLWVKGHASSEENNLVDKFVQSVSKGRQDFLSKANPSTNSAIPG